MATFEDGDSLFRAICDRGLEGVWRSVPATRTRPGERLWVKTKNRGDSRFAEELAGATRNVSSPTAHLRYERPATPGRSGRRRAAGGHVQERRTVLYPIERLPA